MNGITLFYFKEISKIIHDWMFFLYFYIRRILLTSLFLLFFVYILFLNYKFKKQNLFYKCFKNYEKVLIEIYFM